MLFRIVRGDFMSDYRMMLSAGSISTMLAIRDGLAAKDLGLWYGKVERWISRMLENWNSCSKDKREAKDFTDWLVCHGSAYNPARAGSLVQIQPPQPIS